MKPVVEHVTPRSYRAPSGSPFCPWAMEVRGAAHALQPDDQGRSRSCRARCCGPRSPGRAWLPCSSGSPSRRGSRCGSPDPHGHLAGGERSLHGRVELPHRDLVDDVGWNPCPLDGAPGRRDRHVSSAGTSRIVPRKPPMAVRQALTITTSWIAISVLLVRVYSGSRFARSAVHRCRVGSVTTGRSSACGKAPFLAPGGRTCHSNRVRKRGPPGSISRIRRIRVLLQRYLARAASSFWYASMPFRRTSSYLSRFALKADRCEREEEEDGQVCQ